METFGAYSQYYDLLYSDKDYFAETKFVSSLLGKYVPTGQTLLELGCGTGKHATLLAEEKWDVTGIDLSADMLQAANERKKSLPAGIGEKLNFSVGDVRNIKTGRQYDAVISLFHVVSYQNRNEDVLAMFLNAAEHLKPGGVFIFDYWYGPSVLKESPSTRIKRMQSDRARITRLAEPVLDTGSSTVRVNYEIIVQDVASERMTTLRETHSMRYFFLNEIALLLQMAGLRLDDSFEWLTGKEPGEDTWGICSVATK